MSLASQSKLSIARTKKLIKASFRQFIDRGPGGYKPLSLWGHSGIGKTSIIKQVAKELAEDLSAERGRKVTINVRIKKMSTLQPFDLAGYPMVDETSYPGVRVQRFATPYELVEASQFDEDTYTIMFFDEWNRARPEMHNAFMGYLDGDGINEHQIPKQLFVITAANPPTDDGNYGAITDVDDHAILRRAININVVPTTSEFLDFLYTNKSAHSAVQSFLEEDKDRMPKNDFEGITKHALRETNAGLEDLGVFLNYLVDEPDAVDRKALIKAAAQGILGDAAGDLFAERFGQCEFLTTPEELILKGSTDAFSKIKAAVGKDAKGENRLDQVSKVVQNVIRFLNDPTRPELNKTQANRLNKFLDLVPQDMKSQVLKKSKFTENELDTLGFKERTKETLSVTSGLGDKDLTWR